MMPGRDGVDDVEYPARVVVDARPMRSLARVAAVPPANPVLGGAGRPPAHEGASGLLPRREGAAWRATVDGAAEGRGRAPSPSPL